MCLELQLGKLPSVRSASIAYSEHNEFFNVFYRFVIGCVVRNDINNSAWKKREPKKDAPFTFCV